MKRGEWDCWSSASVQGVRSRNLERIFSKIRGYHKSTVTQRGQRRRGSRRVKSSTPCSREVVRNKHVGKGTLPNSGGFLGINYKVPFQLRHEDQTLRG